MFPKYFPFVVFFFLATHSALAVYPCRPPTSMPFSQTIILLYCGAIRRAPSDADINHWSSVAKANGKETMVNGILFSQEARKNYVSAIYWNLLGRTAVGDPGSNYWVQQLGNGQSIEFVVAGVAASSEFLERSKRETGVKDSHQAFIHGLYRLLLGRKADSGGFTWWLNRLNQLNGSRYQVAVEIARSTEYRGQFLRNTYTNPPYKHMEYAPTVSPFVPPVSHIELAARTSTLPLLEMVRQRFLSTGAEVIYFEE